MKDEEEIYLSTKMAQNKSGQLWSKTQELRQEDV